MTEQDHSSLQGLRVIKAPEGTGLAIKSLFESERLRVVQRDVLSKVQHAQQALDDAQHEADAIIAAAHAAADSIRDEAAQAGALEGRREALSMLAQARAEYDALLVRSESDMLDLAFGIAQRIVSREISRDASIIAGIVAQAIEPMRHQRQLVISVHPDDAERLESHRHLWAERLDGAIVHIDADERVAPGGCVIETASGRVDARLDVQLQALRAAMEGPS